MMQKVKRHSAHYVILLGVMGFGLYLLGVFADDVILRMGLVILLASFYVGWGILHHYIHHDVTPKIVLEYVLIGVIGISVIFFLLK